MQVEKLVLRAFRNYGCQEVSLGPGLHVFEGRNAQGKTALLEAIYLAATARSFRTHRDDDLIGWGQSEAHLELSLRRDSGKLRQLSMHWPRQGKRSILLQDVVVRRLAEFLQELPLALFTPDDLELVQGGPQLRRAYLDLLLCKLSSNYLENLGRYQKALRQKLALLKERVPDASQLDTWDALLVQFGQPLQEARSQLVEQLQPLVERLYAQLSGEVEPVQLIYQACPLTWRRSEELRLRSCLGGPQRDELALRMKEHLVRRFGSQGQRRTLALALRLAQAEVLWQCGGERPVVLLDDCFSELDPDRQRRLLAWLEGVSQVLITTAIPLELLPKHFCYRVEAGKVSSC